eukprot:PITA_33378
MVGCVWYLDSGASFHMSGDKNLFSTLEEKDLQMQIEMADDGKYCVSGEGTFVFQRENGTPLTLTDVKYVPVYSHVTKDAWEKLDPTVDLGILIGYTDTPHNYRVYLSSSQRTVVRRDLKFDEQKAMQVSLERELKLHAKEELSVTKEEEPQIDAEQPHAEDPGVETSTHAETSRDGRKCSREADRLMLDARENVGQPSSQHIQRRLPERYTRYMAPVGECVESEPSSFEEAVQQPVWVDAMVEEYNFIIQKSVWDVVLRPRDKSVVSSRWLYKVKQVADGSVEKHKAMFVACGFS